MGLLQTAVKFFTSTVGIIVTLIAVTLGIGAALFFIDIARDAKDDMIADVNAITRQEFKSYVNGKQSGSDVILAVEKYQDRPQFAIMIITGMNTGGFYGYNRSADTQVCFDKPATPDTPVGTASTCSAGQVATVAQMNNTASTSFYVNTRGVFRSQVYYDSVGEARLLVFEQRQ